jgi:hypothetical protein
MITEVRFKYMWKYAGNSDLVASEDGVNFASVKLTPTCPWECGDPDCWFNGGTLDQCRDDS